MNRKFTAEDAEVRREASKRASRGIYSLGLSLMGYGPVMAGYGWGPAFEVVEKAFFFYAVD